MGLYSSKNNYSYSDAVAIDLDTVEESKFDSFDEAAIMAVVESEHNYNSLMKAVGIAELNFLEENGTEMVYTEGTVGGFFAKVKEFFKRVIAKIASVLKAFFAKIDSFAKSDKDFLNKYRKDLTKLNLKDMKVNGYKFSLTEPSLTRAGADAAVKSALNITTPSAVSSADDKTCDGIISKDEDNAVEDMIESYRGTAIGASGKKFEAGEYSKELYEHFRSGESSKEEINVDIVAQMQILATSDDIKKKAEKTFRDQEKLINDFIKELEKAEKDLVNAKETTAEAQTTQGKRIRAVNVVIKAYKAVTGVNTTVFGAYLQALKDQSRQAKAICVKALTYKPKNESGIEVGTTGSFLEGVEFN